jgi:hypothetical protein
VFACRQHQDGGSAYLVRVSSREARGIACARGQEQKQDQNHRIEQRRVGGCARGSSWEQVGRQGYNRTGYGQVRGLHELARNRLAWLAVVVVVARLGLHHGMAERARGVQDERGWGSVGHAVGKQWAVCWRGAVLSGGAGVAVVGSREGRRRVLCGVLCLGAQGAGGSGQRAAWWAHAVAVHSE